MKKYLLLVSLLSIGAVGVAAAQGYGGYGRGNGRGKGSILKQLPAEKEMLFHQTMRKVYDENAATIEKMKSAKEEMKSILTAAKFDEKAFQKKEDELNELRDKLRKSRVQATIELANQFSQSEREILAQMGPKGPGRRWTGAGGPPSK